MDSGASISLPDRRKAALLPTGHIVTSGPIYSGALLIILTGVAVHTSVANVALGVVAVGALVTRTLCEEQLLPTVYPEYQDYAMKTPRLIPFLI